MKSWLLMCLLLFVGLAQAESIHFAVIGDTPYSASERARLPGMLDDIANSKAEFVVHIGDIKGGQERCDDQLFIDRLGVFDASWIPFIYVPGDNEWTDCDRISNGAYDPLERLNRLRELFWSRPETLGQKRFNVERQAGAFPEHVRFQRGQALFFTLNIPGGNNNWGMSDRPNPEFRQRNPVVLAWLKENFEIARRQRMAAVVLLFQADPGLKHFSQGIPHRGYADFLNLLREETTRFPGIVVAVHGDTHMSRVDQPLRTTSGRTIPNFTRVETFGYPYMGWTELKLNFKPAPVLEFTQHPINDYQAIHQGKP